MRVLQSRLLEIKRREEEAKKKSIGGDVKANIPATDAEPPLNTEKESAWPEVIADAVGAVKITGEALFTIKLTLPLVTLHATLLTTTL